MRGFVLILILSLFFAGTGTSVSAQSVKIDDSFKAYGLPKVRTDTGEIGYEIVYLYRFVELKGKLGVCGAVVANHWNKIRRKIVGVTTIAVSGKALKKGLNFMPQHRAPKVKRKPFDEQNPEEAIRAILKSGYIWSVDPAIARGKRAKCRRMNIAWSDSFKTATATFELPSTVWVQR